VDREKAKLAVDKVFRDMAGAMSAGMAFVGTRTGLFRAMQGKGAMRLDDVVHASKLERRYVEEWLKGMVSAGYLDYDALGETYTLPEEMAYFVASDGSDHFVGGMWEMVPALLRLAPKVAEAFEKGGGVRFEDFGPQCIEALDLINRGQYESRFADYWLNSLPEVVERLRAGGRALDFGCGAGRVCIALAKAFPKAEIFGIDVSAESLARAKEAAHSAGVPRIDFRRQLPNGASFDLVTLCDCLHDLASPVETLKGIREVLRKDGTLFIVEPKAADRLEDNRNPVATMFYGFSVFHCMTQSLARGGPGLGTCLGPAGTEKLAREAGFRNFRMLEIKSMTNLFYAAQP
jgi:ubiquinone/menaquinone biosynthesis C-methylase UbiE